MLDPDLVEECKYCLIGAAVYEGGEPDLALTATALARDLADTQPGHSVALLDAGSRNAVAYLDASDLATDAFAAALSRLTSIRARVRATLVDGSADVRPLPL